MTTRIITAPINGTITFEGDNGWGALPELPASLGNPRVSWAFSNGDVETSITLDIFDTEETAAFWTTEDGIVNTAEETFPEEGHTPWEDLEPEDFKAVTAWGKQVHARLVDAVQDVTETAAATGSEAYAAVIAFATGNDVELIPATAQDRAIQRADAALEQYADFAEDRFQDHLTDLRHKADAAGIDFFKALDRSYQQYLEEKAQKSFATELI